MKRQTIEFSKYNPSGNMTILVHSKHFPDEYAAIAKQLMMASHVYSEQVGFIETSEAKPENYQLVMSGNEFCGNATMSYIHYLVENNLIYKKRFQIKVSGYSTSVACEVHDDGTYEVCMPQPYRVTSINLTIGDKLLKATEILYESYVHYVIPFDEVTVDFKQKIEKFIQQHDWPSNYKTIGIMLFDVQRQYLQPLIYIPEVQSLIWENSCASGTASIGIFNNYAEQQSCTNFCVYQPGGNIAVTSKSNPQHGYRTKIKGQVSTVATGKAYIE